MANVFVKNIITEIRDKLGKLEKKGDGYSLYYITSIDTYIYFRYSKVSKASKHIKKCFYGLRNNDIKLMYGKKAFICFVWDDEKSCILIPFNQFEYHFKYTYPSNDEQFKTLIFFKPTGTELYLANIGKFNADSFYGLKKLFETNKLKLIVPTLSHIQVQGLIGAIGVEKGYKIWYPENDKVKIDNKILDNSHIIPKIFDFGKEINPIIREIDVIWFENNKPISFWEVEHTTPIYSGLLRFNDVLLSIAKTDNFNIVAPSDRENKFGFQINRPTFKQNKLIDKVSFINYENIYTWYYNLTGRHYAK